VHLGQVAPLVAFLGFQESRGCCYLRNRLRLNKLARADCFLRALDAGLLPLLKSNPDSPRPRDLLACYARDFKELAPAVGGSFAHDVNLLADR
jgi:hypothetical protein